MMLDISEETIRSKMLSYMKIIGSFGLKDVWKNDTKRLDELGYSSP